MVYIIILDKHIVHVTYNIFVLQAMTPYELAEVTYKRRKDSFFTFRYQKTLEHLKVCI